MIFKFVFIFLFGCAGSSLLCRLCSSCSEQGPRLAETAGFALRWPLLRGTYTLQVQVLSLWKLTSRTEMIFATGLVLSETVALRSFEMPWKTTHEDF